MTTLEEKLGYTFQSPELLENALTHSSCANESRGKRRATNGWNFWATPFWGWWWQTTCTGTTRTCRRGS